MKLQHINIRYYINDNGARELCYTNVGHPNAKVAPNDVFIAPMKIHFYTNKALKIESLVDGTMYPVFKSEFKRILDNCAIDKGIISPCDWAIRSHGGLYSLQVVI